MVNAITASILDIGGLSSHISPAQKPDDPVLDSQTRRIALLRVTESRFYPRKSAAFRISLRFDQKSP
jgi:hypothetical protein